MYNSNEGIAFCRGITKNSEGIKTVDIPFVFDKGVSDSFSVNSLFADLSQDVRGED